MSYLIPVKYHGKKYPFGIQASLREVAGHFDVDDLTIDGPISLHTEYSYGERRLTSKLINDFDAIRTFHKNHVPQLWFNSAWAIEFSKFIKALTNSDPRLKIIEIHPPFNDYCGNISEFLNRYELFEEYIKSIFPAIEILIEHRNGSLYKGGRFLISKTNDIIRLSELIEARKLRLRLVIDIPQLFSAHFNVNDLSEENVLQILRQLKPCMPYVRAIHMWGKKRNKTGRWNAHTGDLNTFFDGNMILKKIFLNEFYDILNDGSQRYFVPEVNSSSDDLDSIVTDFIEAGFIFGDIDNKTITG